MRNGRAREVGARAGRTVSGKGDSAEGGEAWYHSQAYLYLYSYSYIVKETVDNWSTAYRHFSPISENTAVGGHGYTFFQRLLNYLNSTILQSRVRHQPPSTCDFVNDTCQGRLQQRPAHAEQPVVIRQITRKLHPPAEYLIEYFS